MKNYNFVNAQEMHKLHPKTFEVPSDEELNNIKIGDFVKICIYGKLEPDFSDIDNERFWVEVTEINNDEIIGTVDNELVEVDLKYGEKIKFKKENIYSIW
jgi:uncharacterized protein YegJ (DUF2314 family)